MILEVAILDLKPDTEEDFQKAFAEAQTIIAGMNGYVSHQLMKCVERSHRYILLVNWQTLEDHTIGFRQSEEYQQWRKRLHRFYDPFPQVEHYRPVFSHERAEPSS